MPAPDLADDPRHRVGMSRAVERAAGIVNVDAFKRSRKAIGIAFTPHLAVSDDIEPGAFLIADRKQRGIVLRLLEMFRGNTPKLRGAHARRETARKFHPIDQPIRLRVGADEGRGQEPGHDPIMAAPFPLSQPPRSSPRRGRHERLPARHHRKSGGGTTCRPQRSMYRRQPCGRPATVTVRPSSAKYRLPWHRTRPCPPCPSTSIPPSRRKAAGPSGARSQPRPWCRTPSGGNAREAALSLAMARAAGLADPDCAHAPEIPRTATSQRRARPPPRL